VQAAKNIIFGNAVETTPLNFNLFFFLLIFFFVFLNCFDVLILKIIFKK